MLCKILNVSKSGYYKSLNKKEKDTQDDEIVKDVFYAKKGKIGSRTIVMTVKQDYGITMNRKKVQRIMKENNLICIIRKQKRTNIQQTEEQYIKENILNRQFNIDTPNTIICTDITYLHYNNQTCYLAAYIDVCDSSILNYQLAKSLDRSFIIESTTNLLNKYSNIEMIHTDRGSQYTSKDFNNLLVQKQIVHSMSNPGSPLDNAPIESFWGHMKDYLDLKICRTFEDVVDAVDKYMLMYNNRPQWNKNKLSPLEYKELLLAA